MAYQVKPLPSFSAKHPHEFTPSATQVNSGGGFIIKLFDVDSPYPLAVTLKVAVPTDSPVNVIVQLLLDVYKLQLSGLTLIIADSLLNTVTITGLDDVIPWLPDKDTVAVVVAPDSMLSTDKGMINNVPDSIVGELPPVTTKVNVPGTNGAGLLAPEDS